MEGVSPEAASTQAQQIWSMLDDMSENDPAAYRKFIERQMKEAKEHMSPPEPHMCVQVTLLGKPAKPLFINFCSWKHIPEHKNQDPVPLVGTSISQEKDEKGAFSLTSVAFHPKVLDEYGRHAKNHVDADTLIQLALDYIEHEQKVKVTRTYTVLPIDTTHKGDINLIRLSFSKLFKKKKNQGFEKQISELESTFGPLTSQETDSLLSQLSRITEDTDSQDYQTSTPLVSHPEIKIPGSTNSAGRTCLIEEIRDKVKIPKHSLDTCASELGRQLVLKVELPGVKSVSECQLDISEDDVVLEVPKLYELKVKLPRLIDDNQAIARFSKKLSVLTLTMPTKTSM